MRIPRAHSLLRYATFVCMLAASETVLAVNLSFMPGDAFFHAKLTREVVDGLRRSESPIVLNYSYPENSGTFGGFAGFTKLRIENAGQKIKQDLAKLYGALRESDPMILRVPSDPKKEQLELNGFHVFIYNRNVRWEAQKIGLKYNEHWMELPKTAFDSETRKIGFAHSEAARYVPFVSTKEAVIEDWEFANKFDPLNATTPKGTAWGVSGSPILDPATIDMKDIQIVVVSKADLKHCYKHTTDAEFYSISTDGCTKLTWRKDKLKKSKWEGKEADSDDEAEQQ